MMHRRSPGRHRKMDQKEELLSQLRAFGQEHLLSFWDGLDEVGRQRLSKQIAGIDFAAIYRFVSGSDGAPYWQTLARRAHPPRAIRLAGKNEFSREAAMERGEEAVRSGNVDMILGAGGQG